MARSVIFKLGTLVQHSRGLVVPAPPSALSSAVPAFIQDTVDATNRYAALGWNAGGWFTTVGEAEARAVVGFTITHWNMRVSSALGVGETLDFRFVINGTPDATLVASLVAGNDVGSATGSLVIPVDSLIAIEGVVGGTLASKLTRGGIIVVAS